MSGSSPNRRYYKRPKIKTPGTTNPETSTSRLRRPDGECPEPLYPLLAKDSEWVDSLQTNLASGSKSPANTSDYEEILQLVECEEGPQMKPLAVMFPGILDKDPETLRGMLGRAMSTTEVTRHLVDLGQKANFTFMRKADRLIPKDKQWLESLTEHSSSCSLLSDCYSSDFDADVPVVDENKFKRSKKKRHRSA